jgi:hypothetical protein
MPDDAPVANKPVKARNKVITANFEATTASKRGPLLVNRNAVNSSAREDLLGKGKETAAAQNFSEDSQTSTNRLEAYDAGSARRRSPRKLSVVTVVQSTAMKMGESAISDDGSQEAPSPAKIRSSFYAPKHPPLKGPRLLSIVASSPRKINLVTDPRDSVGNVDLTNTEGSQSPERRLNRERSIPFQSAETDGSNDIVTGAARASKIISEDSAHQRSSDAGTREKLKANKQILSLSIHEQTTDSNPSTEMITTIVGSAMDDRVQALMNQGDGQIDLMLS